MSALTFHLSIRTNRSSTWSVLAIAAGDEPKVHGEVGSPKLQYSSSQNR